LPKTAHPELAAPVGHAPLRGCQGGSSQSAADKQTSDQERRDHGGTEAEIRQREVR